MEMKPTGAAPNSRKKLFLKIQKAAVSGISFQNPDPFSPRRDIKSHLKAHQNRGLSGPIIPEARRNNPNKFDDVAIEPTSPKISCMGKIIKQKKKKIISKKKTAPLSKQENPENLLSGNRSGPGFWTSRTIYNTERPEEKGKKRGKDSGDIFGSAEKSGGSAPPRLGQLKKYASVRETLSNFDWKTATATAREDGEEEEEEVIIPFSAPIMMTGSKQKPVVELERKKEINLWKRRTMAQPSPLHLNSVSH